METATCLECDTEITIKNNSKTGDLVKCSKCGTELQIVWLDPVELDWPYYDDDEDDDSYDYEDDDEDYFDDDEDD